MLGTLTIPYSFFGPTFPAFVCSKAKERSFFLHVNRLIGFRISMNWMEVKINVANLNYKIHHQYGILDNNVSPYSIQISIFRMSTGTGHSNSFHFLNSRSLSFSLNTCGILKLYNITDFVTPIIGAPSGQISYPIKTTLSSVVLNFDKSSPELIA